MEFRRALRVEFGIQSRSRALCGSRRRSLWTGGGRVPDPGFGVVQDITLQRLAEDALRRSQQEYRALVESLPVGIAIIQKGVLGYVNGA